IRQQIIAHQSTGALMDLSLAHTLFQTNVDDFGHVQNNTKYTVYPLAFTRHLGNVQADGIITSFGRRMNLVDEKLQGIVEQQRDLRHAQEEDDIGMEIDMEERPDRPPILHAVSSQIYNAISHRVRDAAKFHEVQLGLVTTSLAGTTATSLPSKNRWQRNLDRCRGDLPHVRCAEKVAAAGQPQCMRFENTYRLDVHHLSAQKRSGDIIYAEVVNPLTRSWCHPTVLSAIKGVCVVVCFFHAQVVPELFQCATYPLTCLLEHLWNKHESVLKEGYVVDAFDLEMIAMLERALNYAHTGSSRVLTTMLMDRTWLSLSVVTDGLPCISSSFIHAGSLSSGLITIRRDKWPIHPVTRMPLTASQRSQELTYGKAHFLSYLASFAIKLAMKCVPLRDLNNANSNPVHQCATYAAEIALQCLINDTRTLVKDAVLQEITPLIEQGGLESAVVKPINGVMQLKVTSPPSISLSKFIEDIITQCNTLHPRSKPPFIARGQFLHVARSAIREVTTFAVQQGSCSGKDLELVIQDAFVSACHVLKINQVPWSLPPVAGRRGAPSTRVVHDAWMSLGATNPRGPPTSAALRAHENTPAAIARRTSQHIIVQDSRGEWSAIHVTLKSFHTVLHKSVAPQEVSQTGFDDASGESYIVEAYKFASDAYDPSKPIHHLAVIAGIACGGLLPQIFACKEQMTEGSKSSPAEYTSVVRNLDWVSRENRKKGVKDMQIYIRMVTLYIICMYESESPILKRQRDKTKGISNKKWVAKNSMKGITSFLLCRLGLAKVKKDRGFGSAQWGLDIEPLTQSEVNVLYDNVVSQLRRDNTYGGYDAVQYMMGNKTAELLAKNEFVTKRPTPTNGDREVVEAGSSNIHREGGRKRGEREWEEENEYVSADMATRKGQKRKAF
ncbi:hypothetical protein L210DRAFT_852504, partial [Boletus edulis BED1]